jgi:hypothetical protein
LHICTIIARNYVAFARVLAESFKEFHPDGTCSVLVIDDPTGFIDPAEEPFELLTIDQIGLPDPERMTAWYDVMELSTAVKPWLLRTLLERPGYDSVVYLDPDIRIFAPLEKIERGVESHDVVLTPHFDKPLPRDGRKPSEEDILIAGSYNLGFIGLRGGETADALLDWWSERLENDCLNEPEVGRFVDQRWIDLAPGLWPNIRTGSRSTATRPWLGSATSTRENCSTTDTRRRSAGPMAGRSCPMESGSIGRCGGPIATRSKRARSADPSSPIRVRSGLRST